MKKIILLVLFATLGWQHALAQTFTDGGIYYSVTSTTSPTTVKVVNSNGGAQPAGNITIPEQVTNNNISYSVTGISHFAFDNCFGLTSVTIPNTVTSIGNNAFLNCTGLTSVTIPNSVTSIGTYAFYGCSGLTSVTIPNLVTSIGDNAFYLCSGLTSVTIPNSVTSIGTLAFKGCTGLTSVTIPNSITSIGDSSFLSCTGLTSVTIPNSVTSLGPSAFQSCTGLTSVTISNSVTNIGTYTFRYCSGLTSVTIPNSVTSLGIGAFTNCTGLTSVPSIPNSVTSIGDQSFSGCTGLTSVTFPNWVTSIGNNAFYNCSGLTSVTIPNTVTSIGYNVFLGCTGLTSITIPNSVTSISGQTFFGCTGLTSVTIPNSVTSIGSSSFSGCTGLTSITIPNSVTSIGTQTFRNCTGLTSVTIPNSVTSIGAYAFASCTGLTSVTIPNSVTSIGTFTFSGCTGLTSVVCNITSPLSISANVFTSVNQGACSLTVPAGSVAAYQTASIWQDFAPITSPNPIDNTTMVSACNTYTWANNGQTYTTSGVYTGSTTNNVTEKLDLTIIPSVTYYADADADSYGNVAVTQVSCTGAPVGYVSNSLDCNDTNASVHPGAVEICGDGIDNDCNGMIDETCHAEIKATQWNTTLASLATQILANSVSGCQMYRFEVSNGGIVNTYDVAKYYFDLTKVPGTAYATTYSIRVALKIGGTWGSYGNGHNVTTPALNSNTIISTKLLPAFCGVTLVALDTKIGAVPVYGVNGGYRFEITTAGVTTIYDSAVYNFRLAAAGVAAYGTTYSIRVAAQVNGIYGNYGASCTVTTPVLTVNLVPTTNIIPSLCGTTLASNDAKITAVMITGATNGRYEITKAGSAPVVYEVASTVIKLSQTGVVVDYNTAYTIRVAAFIGGVWGNYGTSCTVTTPAAPIARLKAKSFEVAAYPNPFETTFNLNLETPSKEEVTIAVFDMMGKLVETHQVNPIDVDNLQIGNNFAAGIYNVIVSQANEMQAFRLIRK